MRPLPTHNRRVHYCLHGELIKLPLGVAVCQVWGIGAFYGLEPALLAVIRVIISETAFNLQGWFFHFLPVGASSLTSHSGSKGHFSQLSHQLGLSVGSDGSSEITSCPWLLPSQATPLEKIDNTSTSCPQKHGSRGGDGDGAEVCRTLNMQMCTHITVRSQVPRFCFLI